MRFPNRTLFLLALLIVLTSTSCAHGGEGDGVVGPPAPSDNNWGDMEWDEGEWE